MIKQPEALRLADTLLAYELSEEYVDVTKESAYELRRLYEVNRELVEALEFCAGTSYITDAHEVAEEAIAKAKGESNE
jgi:formyltetrahydrofolate synthetase